MQLTRNPSPFVDARLKSGVELALELSHPDLIEDPNQEQKGEDACGQKPPGEPPWGQYVDRNFSPRLTPWPAATSALNSKSINAMRQRSVAGHSLAAPNFIPVLFKSLQHIAIAICAGICVAKR